MSSYIRQRVKAHVQAVKNRMDAEAAAHVDNLVAQVGAIKTMRHYPAKDGDLGVNVLSFKGTTRGMMLGDMPNALEEFEKDIKSLKEGQFETVEEMRRYCRGAPSLFLILLQYHHIRTEGALIVACPDAKVFRGGKASVTEEDIREFYDKKRSASVVVVFKDGFICFSFEEKLDQ